MGTSTYSDAFKRDAVHQITVRGHPVREVSRRLDFSAHSLYKRMKPFGEPASKANIVDHEAENRAVRLASLAAIAVQIDYERRPGRYGGKPAVVAGWRHKPSGHGPLRSGFPTTSRERQAFLRQHGLEHSMSRHGNCHDNPVAESIFQPLTRGRIRRRTNQTSDSSRQDVFEYIELFYNPKRKHTNNGTLSPVDFDMRQQKLNEAGV